ncbi:MAG: cupin domain-containing protein [Pseudomonadota bacterium]|nr:cupin domain-containing protein [Pseudomonadota bacterium]
MDIARFENALRKDGFAEVETKSLPAGMHNDEHDHAFDVRALVLEGRIALTVDGATRTYGEGEVFTMAAGCRHAEDVGGQGVRYLVGRRRRAAA